MANTKIPSELIADSAITAAKLADGTITTADIADSNVTTAKIADSNVTTAKIGDAQVTTAKIVDANVTTAKIADSNVTTAKIADNNVTTAKLASALTLGGNTTFSGNISQTTGDYLYSGGGNFDIKHTIASQNITFHTTPSGGSATEVLRITHDGKLGKVSGDLTIDVGGDLSFDADGGEFKYLDGGVESLVIGKTGGSPYIYPTAQDSDLIFLGNDGGSQITALTLDMSNAGTAIFNHDIEMADNSYLRMGAGGDLIAFSDGTNGLINANNGSLTLDAASTVKLDAGNAEIHFLSAGTTFGKTYVSSGDFYFNNPTQDKDIVFAGDDGGSSITALRLDMSDAGAAFFNSDVYVDKYLRLRTTDDQTNSWLLYTNTNDKLEFNYNGSGSAEVVVDTSGKVGVGYTSPATKLHVRGVQNDTMNTANAFAAFDGTGGDGVIIGARNSSPHSAYIQSGYTPTIGTSNHYPLLLNPFGGNIGIKTGTTAPESQLHLDGLADGNIITFGQSGRRHHLRTYFSSNATDSVLGFRLSDGNTNGGTVERLTIMGSGNLGINHTSPKATVHIDQVGNSWEDSILIQHDNANTGWNIHAERQDSSLWIGYNSDTSVALTSQGASEKLCITSGGNIGIGVNGPQSLLHVNATNNSAGDLYTQVGPGNCPSITIQNAGTTNNNNAALYFRDDEDMRGSIGMRFVNHSTNESQLRFSATDSSGNTREKMFLTGDGKLGLGVAPSEMLHTYVGSGSNEIRNDIGTQKFYMRHGVNRNSAQGTNVFDFYALNNQDVIIGTGNDFILSTGSAVNSDAEVRMRVNTNGTTVGPVSATATSLTNGLPRRLWVKGGGVFHSNSQSGNTTPKGNNVALLLGPGGTRSTATNAGTVDYNSATSFGSLHGGIAWDHLLNYSTYGNVGYHVDPHGWLGMEMYDTPGYERSNMVMCTRPGTGASDTTQAAMRWMATGEITTPRNPAFSAYGTGLSNQTTEGNHGSWTENFDRGGNYVGGTTNVFTAPVDGLYFFYAHTNFNSGSSTPYYWRAIKNNGGIGIFYGSGSESWEHINATILVNLDKNDTFEWKYKGDPDEGAEWAQLGGYMVG